MGTIIRNGSTSSSRMYRYNDLILRTPIVLNLAPYERTYYSVAGSYSAGLPNTGYIRSLSYANTQGVGSDCVKAALNPTGSQIWRVVSNSHDPEFVWYQGSYATSATDIATGIQSSEAFLQLCGYHFALPSNLNDLTVTKVTVSFTLGGGIVGYQMPLWQSANNSYLYGKYSFSNWFMPIQVCANLNHPVQMSNLYPYDTPIDILSYRGSSPTGYRDLWMRTSTSQDGGIPTLLTPPTVSYDLGANTLAAFNANRGGWIVPNPELQWSGNTSYRPYYWPTQEGYWACVSMWGFSCQVTLE